MLYGIDLDFHVPAEFVKTISTTVQFGKETYSSISPYYTAYSFVKYAKEMAESPSVNLTALGNFALTALSIPGVQANMAKALEASVGVDHELMQTYLYGAVTCLNVAATVLPLISSYVTPSTQTKQNVKKIKEAVQKIDQTLNAPQAQQVKEQTSSQKKTEPQNRKNILSHYPQKRKENTQSRGKGKHNRRRNNPKK